MPDMSSPVAFKDLAVAGIQSLIPYEPGKSIAEIEREYGVKDVLKLASNENPFGPSPLAIAAVAEALPEAERYPDGNGFVLKKKCAARHGLQPEQVVLGNGSNEILELIARVFLSAGRSALFSEHAFAVYPLVTQAVGAESIIVKAHAADHAMPYGHDLQAMLKAIKNHTRVIFIANPNNPTGTWLEASEFEQFLTQVPDNILVVVDEAYFEYVDKPSFPDTSQWLEQFPNLLVTRTFSKIFGLAGFRIGYGLCATQVSELLNRARQPFNVNSFAMVAAVAALDDVAFVEKSITTNLAGMDYFKRQFSDRGFTLIPSAANFVCVDLKSPSMEIFEKLLHEAVIVRPVANYGLPSHIRITVGTQNDNERVMKALDKVMRR